MIKRPILIIAICYIIGIILGLYLKNNIVLFVLLFIGIVVAVIVTFLYRNSKKLRIYNKLIIMCIITIIISSTIVSKLENNIINKYRSILGECKFTGVVTEVGKDTEYYNIYTVKVESIENSNLKKFNILLKVKKNKQCINFKYGDRIKGIGTFEAPNCRRNFKGFDYCEYLKTKRVYNICVSNGDNMEIIKENSLFVGKMWINCFKNRIKNNLVELLPQKSANISLALIIGDTSRIETEQRQVFSEASLSHILAISGMHVSFIIVGLNYGLKYFNKRRGKYIFIVLLIFFSIFTGNSPSVVRAVVMSIIAICSTLVYKKSDTLNNIAISCLLLLIINPYNIFNLGFQLSFLGTLGIVLFNSRVSNMLKIIKFKKLSQLLSVSISANLMILPIIVNTYNTISFVFIISNILVAPILGIMCFCGYLTSIVSLISMEYAKVIAYFLNTIIELFEKIALVSSSFGCLKYTVCTPNFIFIIVYYSMLLYLLMFHKKRNNKVFFKILAIILVIVIFGNVILKSNSKFHIYFVDVGQGDCTVIVTQNGKTIIVDGGGSETGNYDVGKNVLLPYLLDRGIKSIDYIIVSHFDSDHVKGLLYVMENLSVKNAIISKQGKESENYNRFIELSNNHKIKITYVEARK